MPLLNLVALTFTLRKEKEKNENFSKKIPSLPATTSDSRFTRYEMRFFTINILLLGYGVIIRVVYVKSVNRARI